MSLLKCLSIWASRSKWRASQSIVVWILLEEGCSLCFNVFWDHNKSNSIQEPRLRQSNVFCWIYSDQGYDQFYTDRWNGGKKSISRHVSRDTSNFARNRLFAVTWGCAFAAAAKLERLTTVPRLKIKQAGAIANNCLDVLQEQSKCCDLGKVFCYACCAVSSKNRIS